MNTRKPCYRKDDRAMRPTYKLFILIFTARQHSLLCRALY